MDAWGEGFGSSFQAWGGASSGHQHDHKSTNQVPLFLEPTLEKSWVEVEEV